MLGRLLKGLFGRTGGDMDCREDAPANVPPERSAADIPAARDLSARLNDEGVLFYGGDRLQEAALAFQRAIKADATNADAVANLGIVLARTGNTDRALEFFERSLAIRPSHLGTLTNYAFALRESDRYEEAIRALNQVLEGEPRNLERWCDLALVHKDIGQLGEARRCCERVLALDSAYTRAYTLLGGIALDAGRFDEAETSLQSVDESAKGAAQAILYRAFLRLGRYEFAQGWEDYQSRKRIEEESPVRPYPFPEWRGESLAGKRMLVYAEQGLGDEIMFASCVPDVAARAEQVILECDPRLASLFSRAFPGNVNIVPLPRKGTDILPTAELGSLDFQVPAGDLPRFFRRTLDDFPAQPFLVADPERVIEWRRRLDAMGPGPKLGLAWRGGLGKTRSRVRSLPAEDLASLVALAGIRWFSLQFRPTPEERGQLGYVAQMNQEFPSFGDADYAELAAFVRALDGVVSVCSSTVHFAGALGAPTWVATPFVPEWRYSLAGETMPWYPSVRLYRQERLADWTGATARLRAELTRLVR